MGPVEEALANKFLPKLLGLQSISERLRKQLSPEVNRAGLQIPDPMEAADKSYRTLQVCCERLVEYLLTGEALSTEEHRACVRRGSRNGMDWKKDREEAQLVRELRNENNRGRLRLGRAKVAGAWMTVVPDLLNRTTLLAEEFRDNLRISFRLVPLALRLTCDRCGEKFTVNHSLQFNRAA